MLFRRLALAPIALLISCVQTEPTPLALSHAEFPIVMGELADPSDYPSTVALTDPKGDTFCSGTLIGKNVVVTAAHCLDGTPATEIRVVYGFSKPAEAPDSALREVSLAVMHPDYDAEPPTDVYGMGESNDVAVVVLKEPVDGAVVTPVLPVSLVDQELTPNRPVHIVGYGVTDAASQKAGVLYKAITPHVRHIEWEMLAGRPGEPDTCYGDSGGPGYVVVGGVLYLAGITSRAYAKAINPCGEATIYTLAPAHLAWIESVAGPLEGATDAGFEGGGWPPQDASADSALLDVQASCLPPDSECNPLTNEGCDQAKGEVCQLDWAKSRVQCHVVSAPVKPGGTCDETSLFCMPGFLCGRTIKCEKACCSDADCPEGISCKPMGTLLGDVGTCGVIPWDASVPDAAPDAAESADAADEADAEDSGSKVEAGLADGSAAVLSDVQIEGAHGGCSVVPTAVPRGEQSLALIALATCLAIRVRRRNP